jgi:hypothetical protein
MKPSRFRQIHTLKGRPFRENETPNLKPSPFHQIHSNQSWLSWTIQPDQITCKNENGDDHDGQLIVWSAEMTENGDFCTWNEQPEYISPEQRRIACIWWKGEGSSLGFRPRNTKLKPKPETSSPFKFHVSFQNSKRKVYIRNHVWLSFLFEHQNTLDTLSSEILLFK